MSAAPARTITAPTGVDQLSDSRRIATPAAVAITGMKYVTIWAVRSGDDLFVRSAYGPDNGWFRRAKASRTGRIRAGGVERDVAFVDAAPETHTAVDAAYEEKYRRHPASVVATVVGPAAAETTFRLAPADTA